MPLMRIFMNSLTSDRNQQAYIAIALISLLPNLILIPIPYDWLKADLKNGWDLRSIFMCFASAGLLGDVFLHTLPHLLGAEHHHNDHHDHEHHNHQQEQDQHRALIQNDTVTHEETCNGNASTHSMDLYEFVGMDRSLFITLVVMAGFLTFFLTEKIAAAIMSDSTDQRENGASTNHHSHSHSHSKTPTSKEAHGEDSNEETSNSKKLTGYISVSAVLNLIADSLHNFTDGLAIGASFSGGQGLGLATFLSIICHELPHEIGDFTILIQSGFTKFQAIQAQFVTAIAAVLGTVIGLQAQRNQVVEDLLLAFTSGGFLFLSTVTMLPSIVQKESSFAQIAAEAVSFVLGIAMMVIVALFE